MSATAGLGWTIESTGFSGDYTSIALDSNGYPHISYLSYPAPYNLTYAYKDTTGWHNQTIDASDNYLGAYTSLLLDSSDYPHICYIGDNGNLKYAHQDATGWHTENATTEGGTEGTFCSIVLDGNGYPHISYKDYNVTLPDGHLKYAYKDATGWHIESVAADGEYTDIALDSNGYPHISYRSWDISSGYKLEYAYKDNTGWHSLIVDTASADTTTSIALNASNYPRIGYYSGYLKYAYKDVSGWHLVTVDAAGNVGAYTSMVLDNSGNPHISYYDWTNRNLKYAFQDTSGWYTATVDSAGDVGRYTSVTLDDGGYPHISYWDFTNNSLKYAYASLLPGPYTLAVTKTGTGSGIVTSNPPGINCGQTCSTLFPDGTVVILTAATDVGSAFAGWSGDADCSDGQVTMSADRTCIATFISFRVYLPIVIK